MRTRCPSERRLLQLVDGELPLDERFSLDEHLEGCSRCRERHARHLRLDEALLGLPAPEIGEADRRRLLEGVREARRRTPEAARVRTLAPIRRPRQGWRRAAAAVLVIGGSLAVWTGRSKPGSAPPSAPAASPTAFPFASTDQVPGRPAAGEGALEVHAPGPLDDAELVAELSRGREERARVRGEVLDWLRSLPVSGSLPTPIVAPFTSGDRPASLVLASLESLLSHEESVVGCNAARILAHALDEDALPLSSPSLVAALERALDREDRAAHAFFVLRRLDHPGLQAMIGRVVERAALRCPSVRRSALLELALRFERGAPVDLERTLLRLLRSDLAEDRRLLAEVLTRTPFASVPFLQCLHSLYEEGAPQSLLAPAAQRLGDGAVAAIERSLGGQGPFELGEALDLAGLCRRPALVEHVLPHARAGRHAAAAVDTLAAIGGVEGHVALFELLSGSTLSRSRQRVVEAALVDSLHRAELPGLLVRGMARRCSASAWPRLLEVVSALGTATSAEVCLELAGDGALPESRRAASGVLAAMRDPGMETAAMLDLLRRSGEESSSPGAPLSPFAASMLVSLHVLDERSGLQKGLDLLQIPLDARRRASLVQLAEESARDLHGPRFERDLRRIGEILAGG